MTSIRFINARVVDVEAATVSAPGELLVRDGIVVGPGSERAADAAEVVDVDGRFLAPGLVSVHSHLSVKYPFSATDENEPEAASLARALPRAVDAARAGITSIRAVHEQNRADMVVRSLGGGAGAVVPRIWAAGRALSRPDGHGHGMGCVYARGPEAFAAIARAELDAGADHLKIFITGGIADAGEDLANPQMEDDEIRAVVDVATERKRYVVAHAASGVAIDQALACGVRSFEHAYRLREATARRMADAGAFLTPTLCVTRMPDWMRANSFTEDQVERAMEIGGDHLDSIRTAVKADITLVNGTDYPPGSLDRGVPVAIREIGFAMEAGLSPIEALRTATVNAARLIRAEGRVGTLRPGAHGDAVILDADPLVDPLAYARPRNVFVGGSRIS